MNAEATVYVVDDDAAVRNALVQLLSAAGYAVESYESGSEFLAACQPDRAGCVILDIQMPGMNGLELQTALAERHCRQPIIFLTGHGTISMAVGAINHGAFDFLEKPVDGKVLLARVGEALQHDAERRREEDTRNLVLQRWESLTARERSVVPLVVAGRSSKEIARQLGISDRTVETHRAHIMQKMGASSVAELTAMGQGYGLVDVPLPAGTDKRGDTR